MEKNKAVVIIGWIIRVLVALQMGLAGLGKFTGPKMWTDKFAHYGYAGWFVTVIATLELGGAVLLLIPKFSKCGMMILSVVLLGACYTHLTNGEAAQIVRPLIPLVLLTVACWLNRPAASAAK